MKNVLSLGFGLSLFAISLTANAQINSVVKFGVKAGGNMMMGGKADLGGTDYTSKFLPGFQGGFYAEIL